MANADRQSKWDLVEAIVADSVEHGIGVVSCESVAAARTALAEAGHEHTLANARDLCVVAKFDHESTPEQRSSWRRYGWTIARQLAKAAWFHELACEFLAG